MNMINLEHFDLEKNDPKARKPTGQLLDWRVVVVLGFEGFEGFTECKYRLLGRSNAVVA